MLVNKQIDYTLYQEQTVQPARSKQSKPDLKLRVRCLTIVVLAAVLMMVVAIQREMIVRSGYGLVELKNQIAQLERDNERLRLDIAKMKSPQRIQQIAITQLGMVKPQGVYCASTGLNTDSKATQLAADKQSGSSLTNRAEASSKL